MKTQCSHCRAKFNVADQHKGQRARCSKCGQPFVIAAIQESKPVEICSHCLRTIGADDQMHVFESKIVCGDCDVKLRSRTAQAKPAGSVSAAGPAPGSKGDTTNAQQRRYVPMSDEASLIPWIAARRLNVAGPVNPDASTVWATMIGWLARGDGVGFRYAWHIILWAIVLEWLLLPAAVALTCGLGALFLVPQLITAFLAMYLRLLYGKATSLRNLFDGFKHYVELLVLALITFGLTVVFWIVSHIILGMILISVIYKVWGWGPVGKFVIILLAVLPFVLVAGINLVFFTLPSLMVMDRGAGPIVALRLMLVAVMRHIKALVLYVIAIGLLLGLYVAFGVALMATETIVGFLLGLVVLVLGYGHCSLAGPGWIAVVYESFFPPTEVIRLADGRELPSLISQETQQAQGGHS